jgi:hypothetical protein
VVQVEHGGLPAGGEHLHDRRQRDPRLAALAVAEEHVDLAGVEHRDAVGPEQDLRLRRVGNAVGEQRGHVAVLRQNLRRRR